MRISIECPYCGKKTIEVIYNQDSLLNRVCNNGNCTEKRLIIKDLSGKVNYYEGCPPFPENER